MALGNGGSQLRVTTIDSQHGAVCKTGDIAASALNCSDTKPPLQVSKALVKFAHNAIIRFASLPSSLPQLRLMLFHELQAVYLECGKLAILARGAVVLISLQVNFLPF